MTIQNLRYRLARANAEGPTELVEAIRDALRRGYTEGDIDAVVGPTIRTVAQGLIRAGECNGLCLTGSDVGVPSVEFAYPHPDCPEHGDG